MKANRKEFNYIKQIEEWNGVRGWGSKTSTKLIPFQDFVNPIKEFIDKIGKDNLISVNEIISESYDSYGERTIIVWYWSN